jgi:hypothetical protein
MSTEFIFLTAEFNAGLGPCEHLDWSLGVSKPYWSPRLVTGIALLSVLVKINVELK